MKQLMAALRPDLTERQAESFELYYELLTDWNERINLTAITEKEDVAGKHFVDSLAAADLLPEGAACIDVGTGAGFPGVPLLILRPDLKMTLLDSLQKRLGFLDELLRRLGLTAELVHARAEDAGRDPKRRERYDVVLSRAVSPLPVLLELTTPFLKPGGTAIAYKGNAAQEIADAARAARLLNVTVSCLDVASGYGARTLVLAKKTAPTPKAYPRKAGTPSKQPL